MGISRTLRRSAAALVVAAAVCVCGTDARAAQQPVVHGTPGCSNNIGRIPCNWTTGVNAYPGNGNAFRDRGALGKVAALVSKDAFDTVAIDVPISAANFTDAHVEMPGPGSWQVYACVPHGQAPGSETYYSPSPQEIVAIGRKVLRADSHALVIIRPMLALGGDCDPADYYPTGRFYGTGYSRGGSNAGAFAHFYTGILERLALDAKAIGHTSHVVLDDASELDCLFDDPAKAGYIKYFDRLPSELAARAPKIPQMFSLPSDFTDHSDVTCGWPGTFKKTKKNSLQTNEVLKDKTFLRAVGLVGIDENFPLGYKATSPDALYTQWQTVTQKIAGSSSRLTADDLVRYLHGWTGRDVVLSSIGYVDCSYTPAANPAQIPAVCNKIISDHAQQEPGKDTILAEHNAVRAAYCYWTESEAGSSPWFLGLWWWNRDFDLAPYVDPYDLSWGDRYGNSALETIAAWQHGHGSCAGVGGISFAKPGPQTTAVGQPVSLQINASDLALNQTLDFSATGLPAGLTINAASGLITGSPTDVGTYDVTVTAVNANGPPSRDGSFVWTITS